MVPADSRRISRDPRYSGYHWAASVFMYGTFTLCGAPFQTPPFHFCVPCRGPTTPRRHCYRLGLGSSPFARHYWGNHCYFLFLRVLRCFSSPGSPPHYGEDSRPSGGWVVPFGNLGVNGHLRLTQAYRSLSRPSSPPRAKASTRRPNLLSPSCRLCMPRDESRGTVAALLILSAVI